jgi:hypothetical protein
MNLVARFLQRRGLRLLPYCISIIIRSIITNQAVRLIIIIVIAEKKEEEVAATEEEGTPLRNAVAITAAATTAAVLSIIRVKR